MTRKNYYTSNLNKMYHFAASILFYDIAQLGSRLKPSGSSRWSQRFSQALGFARLDSVSLLFASYLDDFSSLQYRYVCGWNMRYKRFHLFMDSEPEFYFICATNPPASLCASRPTFNSEDLFTSVWETCMDHGAIHCCYLISLRTKMNRGVSLLNISVCFDYNIQVLWLTSNRCWADVRGRHQPNVEATLDRHRTADMDPTSAQHMFPCSFFSLHNLPELLCLCAKIVPMLEAAINSGPVLALLQTYCTLTSKLDSYFLIEAQTKFQMHFVECKYMNFD